MGSTRTEQREETRKQIVSAALEAISESGFEGVSTREIARRANVSQGLLTYHFKTKNILWRAAADHLFEMQKKVMGMPIAIVDSGNDSREALREMIRRLVSFNAAHPEFMRFLFDCGTDNGDRSRWLAETHLRPLYAQFGLVMEGPKAELPHAFYVIVGASGLIFCAANECKNVTGVNSMSKAAIKRHANYVANLIVPE